MQLNPARGRKPGSPLCGYHYLERRFMQLNPARGRKLERKGRKLVDDGKVYAAQPREGTETSAWHPRITPSSSRRFMQLNPARGRKPTPRIGLKTYLAPTVYAAQPREGTETKKSLACIRIHRLWVYAAQPREGTETRDNKRLHKPGRCEKGLCSSTPRGDGNSKR